MKKPGHLRVAGIALLSLLLITPSAWTQSNRRLHYSTLFNPGTVGTLSGEVVRVTQVPAGSGAAYFTRAVLRTPAGDISIIAFDLIH